MPPFKDSSVVRVQLKAEMLKDDDTLSSAQAQMLFMALRNVIIPLIQAAVPNCPDLHEFPLESEAKNFLAELQNYISRLNDQNGIRITRTVDLEESLSVNLTDQESDKINASVKESHEIPPGTVSSSQARSQKSTPSLVPIDSSDETPSGAVLFQVEPLKESESVVPRSLSPPDEARFNEALSELRKRVFNEMPMRLLCFENRGFELDITLLDRVGIYSHLESKLKNFLITQRGQQPRSLVDNLTPYAILSHTWIRSPSGEVTYEDWNNSKGAFDLMHPGYQKLIAFCRTASEKYDLIFGWMDTVCINKSSSAELDESIRSMYKWYASAKVCITYLAETTTLSEMAKDPWFTRGWTLQELLAPRSIVFYNANWWAIGRYTRNYKRAWDDLETKGGVAEQIKLATTITESELHDPTWPSVSRKMQWAAKREVTREEDASYSLMGIFDVNMSIAYGEGGEVAFNRLIEEILRSASSFDAIHILNWGFGSVYGPNGDSDSLSASRISRLLPSSAKAYLRRSPSDLWGPTLLEPLTLTHLGLRVPILLLPASDRFYSYEFTPRAYTPIGDYYATITITKSHHHPIMCWSYNVLPDKNDLFPYLKFSDSKRTAFGILNCGGDESSISIPENCLAIGMEYTASKNIAAIVSRASSSQDRIETTEPIVFSLRNKREPPEKLAHSIKRTELEHHGMRLLTMYL